MVGDYYRIKDSRKKQSQSCGVLRYDFFVEKILEGYGTDRPEESVKKNNSH